MFGLKIGDKKMRIVAGDAGKAFVQKVAGTNGYASSHDGSNRRQKTQWLAR